MKCLLEKTYANNEKASEVVWTEKVTGLFLGVDRVYKYEEKFLA